MAKELPPVRQHLSIVEVRLAETLQVFAAYSTINRAANKEVNPGLNAIVNTHGGFWNATAISFQTHLFTGIYALVELAPKVVTLATIGARLTKESKRDLKEVVDALGVVRKRYEKFRHTLFGHNGKDRQLIADGFDEYGFTWDMIENDLATLEHSFKVLWRAAQNESLPSWEESTRMRFPYAHTVESTSRDTLRLLGDLQNQPHT